MKETSPDLKTKTGRFAGGRAIVVGISNYHSQYIPLLPEAVLNDARDVAAVVSSRDHCGYEEENLQLLLDGDATLIGIRQALHVMANASHPEDTALIFFSGHGAVLDGPDGPVSGIVPVDCDPRAPGDTCLWEPELSETLRSIPAQRLLILIDACHSGGAGSFKNLEPPGSLALGYSEKSLEQLAQGVGRVLIASSRASETSLVFRGERNSVFTGQLLEALRGQGHTSGDGLIRVFGIFNHVCETVKHRVPGNQHPIFKANDLEDNFPVTLDRGGTKTALSETDRGTAKGRWDQLIAIMPDLYPLGPADQEIWRRAGGDLSRINLSGTGREQWFRALQILRHGGGGEAIQVNSLIAAALEDFPHHSGLVVFS